MCVWAPVKARSGFRGLNTHTHTQKIRFLFLSTESSHLLRCGSVWLCSLQISEMSITTLRESTSISALNTITPSSTCPSLVEGCYSNAGLRSVLRLTWLLFVIIRAECWHWLQFTSRVLSRCSSKTSKISINISCWKNKKIYLKWINKVVVPETLDLKVSAFIPDPRVIRQRYRADRVELSLF